MKIDITKLKNLMEEEITINEEILFPKEDVLKAEMLELKPVKVNGIIRRFNEDYNVILEVEGKMVLPCALTLKPVDYGFNFKIDEIFSENAEES